MKKIFALALLLGLGMMVGCGDDTKPKTSSTGKSTASTTKDTGTTTTIKDTSTTVTPKDASK